MIKPSTLLTTSSNLFEKFFHLIQILQLEIKFEGPTISNFDWIGRETNWPALKSIKKQSIPNRLKNSLFNEKQNEKDILKSSSVKVVTFMKQPFAS